MSRSPSPSSLSFPLVGREQETARLLARLGDPAADASPARGVVVVGAAGVGKSRLVQHCLPALEGLGFRPIVVAASPALADVPFGVFREVLPPFDDQVGSWLRVLREGTGRLVETAGGGRPLLVVDDLHELDPGSVALILHALDADQAHLLGTMRAEAELRPHVLDMIKRFWGDQLADRIDLGPLSRRGVSDLAGAVLGAPLDAVSTERLWSWTGGNALLLWHALADGSTAESFDARAGLWQLDRGPIGPEVAAAVERVLGTVPEDVRRVARFLAEADALSLAVLVEAAGPDAVDAAEDSGLVVSASGPRGFTYRLQHPLYGDVLLAAEDDDERRRIRHELATAMITTAGSVERVPAADRVLLALWYVDQRDLGPDAQTVLLDAASQSLRSWHHRAAVRFAEPVWERVGSVDAGLILCRAYDALGLDDEACVVARQLLDDAQDDLQRLIATIQLAGAENRRTGMVDRSRDIIERTIAELTDTATPLWENGLRIYLATILMHDARFDDARAIVEPFARAGDDVGETVAVLGPIGAVQGRVGETLAMVRPIAASMARGRQLLAAQPWLVSVIEGLVLLEDGALAEARTVLQRVYEEGLAGGDVEIVAWSALQLARVAMLEGIDLDHAVLGFREAAAAYGEMVRPGYVAWALGGLAGALALVGDPEGAAHAAAAFDASPVHPVRLYEADAARARAWSDACAGAVDRAVAQLERAASVAHDTGQWVIEAASLHDLARLGAHGVLPRAVTIASRPGLDSRLVAARVLHIEAIADGTSADRFEQAASAFTALGTRAYAAEAWAGAARVRGRAGDTRSATRAALRARAALGPERYPQTPLLAGLPTVRLTRQQLSIARFAATGVSRQSIADQCFVSLRTVDRHLVDVFLALGIHRREELAGALADLDASSHHPT